MLAEVEKFAGLVRLLERPVVVMRIEDTGIGYHPGVLEGRGEQFEFFADLADFLEDTIVAFEMVRQHRAVKLFTADAGLPPTIIKHAARAARDQLVGKQP